ncbi:MAG: PfkB family carbohydrate kinase [Tissierellia bacterium]|nr:PfkB family carbohydrate kinase [Tissierellia bacterium]
MLVLADPNPRLRRKLIGESFPKGRDSVARELDLAPGGRGGFMAELAVAMDAKVTYVTLLGGSSGVLYHELLRQIPMTVKFHRLRDNTRESIVLEEGSKLTTVHTPSPRVTGEDISEFFQDYLEAVQEGQVVVAVPNELEDDEDLTGGLIQFAKREKTPIFVKYREGEFPKLSNLAAYGLVISREDLKKLSGKEMTLIGEIGAFVREQMSHIPLVLVTGSKKGVLLFTPEKVLYGFFEDSEELSLSHGGLLIGLACGMERNYGGEQLLKLSMATGATKVADFAEIKGLMSRIEVQEMEVK